MISPFILVDKKDKIFHKEWNRCTRTSLDTLECLCRQFVSKNVFLAKNVLEFGLRLDNYDNYGYG